MINWALQLKLTDLLHRAVMKDDEQAEAVLVDYVMEQTGRWGRYELESHFSWCRSEWARYWFRARDATFAGAMGWLSKECEAKLRRTLAWAAPSVPGLIEIEVTATWGPTGYSDRKKRLGMLSLRAELSDWLETFREGTWAAKPSVTPGYPHGTAVSGRAKWHKPKIQLEVARGAPFEPIPGWERELFKGVRKFYRQPYDHWEMKDGDHARR